MKIINSQFINEQEIQNDVVQKLRAEIAPIQQMGKEKSEKLIQLHEQYAIAIADLFKSYIDSDCIVKCEFGEYDNGLKFSVNNKNNKEENDWRIPSFDIYFFTDNRDGEKIGDVKNINNIQTRFYNDEPHNQVATYNMLIALGALAEWIKNNASGWVIIQNYFLELNALKNEVGNINDQLLEINTKIKIEQLSIVKFEIEMFFYEGNAILEVEKFKKVNHYGSDYPLYSLHNANLLQITNIARTTTQIKSSEANFEYDSKKSEYKNVPYNFLNVNYDKRYKQEEYIDQLTRNAVNKNHILFLFKKPETAQLIETTGGDSKKFKDKTLVTEICKILEEETEKEKEKETEKETKE